MAKIDQRREKRAANDRYRERIAALRIGKWKPRKARRKKARRERTEQRELAWLKASGVERDERFPLA